MPGSSASPRGGSLEAQVRSWAPLWQVLAALGFGVWLIFLAVRQSTKLRRYLKTLRAGVPAERHRPYRLSCAGSAAMGLLWLFYLSALLANVLEPNSRRFEPADAFDEPVPHVAIVSEEDVMAIRWTNWLTSDQWWTLEDGGDPEARYAPARPATTASGSRGWRTIWRRASGRTTRTSAGPSRSWSTPAWTRSGPGRRRTASDTSSSGWGTRSGDVGVRSDRPTEELLSEYAAVLAEFQ